MSTGTFYAAPVDSFNEIAISESVDGSYVASIQLGDQIFGASEAVQTCFRLIIQNPTG